MTAIDLLTEAIADVISPLRCEGCGLLMVGTARAGSRLDVICNLLINPRRTYRNGTYGQRLEHIRLVHLWLRGPAYGWGGYRIATLRRLASQPLEVEVIE